ncbi:MAG: polyphenol oxidase family protein [Myxococcota bacterium]
MSAPGLRHGLLDACGVEHGFGERSSLAPPDVLRPTQVHGRSVARVGRDGTLAPEEADAVISSLPGRAVAVVTADCVPVLAASRDGRWVAAIHAGWKGLALGVIPAALSALRGAHPTASWVAVVGPHIGRAHYEVDRPVLDPLRAAFGDDLDAALAPTGPGHALLDLGRLAQTALDRAGLAPEARGAIERPCTFSQPERFHSHRRDGAAAGRLLHHIAPRSALDRS